MMGWARQAAAVLGIWALCLTTGCGTFFIYTGNSSGSSSSANYVYVANGSAQSLAGYSLSSGALTAISGLPLSLGFIPTAVVVNPANTYVYVGGNSAVYGFSIGSGGVLTALGNPLASVSVRSMAITPDGQYLYVLDQTDIYIDWFPINSNGTLGTLGQTLYSNSIGAGVNSTYGVINPTTPQELAFSPNGDCLFVGLGTAGHLGYPITNDIISSSTAPQVWNLKATATQSDNALAVTPNGSYLYVARSGTNGGVAAETISYTSSSMCQVSEAGNPTVTGDSHPFSVAANNSDVYVANQVAGTISGYSIGSGGALTALATPTYSSGSGIDALALDKTGDYLLGAAGGGSPDLTIYSFDSSSAGKLDTSNTYSTGNGTEPADAVALAMTH